jgi:pSer/pThr/pTyr-binding forkhead associated (FHA) protein
MTDGTMSADGDVPRRAGAGGRADTFLIFHDGEGREQVLDLSADRVTIGRGASNDVALEWDMSVSRLHAEMQRLGEDWTIVDDGLSRNGTYLNGERLSGRRRLRDGDSLRIGESLIVFHEPEDRQSGGTVMASDSSATARLSATQKKVLTALCRPYKGSAPYAIPATNQQIAQELYLSVDAVKTHLRVLFSKFNVEQLPQNQKRVRLVEIALTSGIITERDISAP